MQIQSENYSYKGTKTLERETKWSYSSVRKLIITTWHFLIVVPFIWTFKEEKGIEFAIQQMFRSNNTLLNISLKIIEQSFQIQEVVLNNLEFDRNFLALTYS